MKKLTLPQLHQACAKDKLRTSLNHVFVTKDEIAVSNGHILVVHKTADIFNCDFIENMPNEFFIHRNVWADLCKPHWRISFDSDKKLITQYQDGFTKIFPIVIDATFKFPQYKSVFPKENQAENIGAIGINMDLLEPLKKALFYSGERNIVTLRFFGAAKVVLVTVPESNSKALIVPCTIIDNP